jgi:hypothetical protein
MNSQDQLSIKYDWINEGECKIEFNSGNVLLYGAIVYFDIHCEFWNEENLQVFYEIVNELMEGKALNSENCHYALNMATNEYDSCNYFDITTGYEPTLLNRYSEN